MYLCTYVRVHILHLYMYLYGIFYILYVNFYRGKHLSRGDGDNTIDIDNMINFFTHTCRWIYTYVYICIHLSHI
jgi:hypothetical protein